MSAGELLSILTDERALLAVLQQGAVVGIAIVAAIVFVETGVVVMPFLPGDSLLFLTGTFLAATGHSIVLPGLVIATAAIAGDALNYTLARTMAGPWILRRRLIRERHLERTRDYFRRFGGTTITMARFVPIVRTLAPFVGGISGMAPRRFFVFNVVGGVAWVGGLLALGALLGRVPWVRDHLSLVSLGIVVLSLVPVAWQVHAARASAATDAAPAKEGLRPRG